MRRDPPVDIVAFGRYVIWNWPMGEAAGDLGRAGIPFAPQSYRGSNEMLIAPKRTAMNAPIAVIDPHVQWYRSIRFYEVRIYTPEFNVAGVSLLGVPLPSLGHSRYCSVAMTTGGPDTSDIFEEEDQPGQPSPVPLQRPVARSHRPQGDDPRQGRREARASRGLDRVLAPRADRGLQERQGLRDGHSLLQRGGTDRPVL